MAYPALTACEKVCCVCILWVHYLRWKLNAFFHPYWLLKQDNCCFVFHNYFMIVNTRHLHTYMCNLMVVVFILIPKTANIVFLQLLELSFRFPRVSDAVFDTYTQTHKNALWLCIYEGIASVSLVPYKQMKTPISQHAFCLLFILGWVTVIDTNYREGGSERQRSLRDRRQRLVKGEKEVEQGWKRKRGAQITTQERGGEGETGWQGFSFLIVRSFVDSLWAAQMSHDYRRH